MEKSRRFSVITLVGAVLLCLLTLPSIFFTWNVLRTWLEIRLRLAEGYYIGHWLDVPVLGLIFAVPFLLILAGVGALAAIHPRWPKSAALVLPLGILVAFYTMICIPNVPLWHLELIENSKYLASIEQGLDDWYQGHGHYPVVAEELQGALQGRANMLAPYARAGQQLAYEVQLERGQSRPFKTEPERPGIVYYAVDSRGEQFWLTVSGLNALFAERAVMARTDAFAASKQPWKVF